MAENMEGKRLNQMVECLENLDDNDLIDLFRSANSWDGSYEFVDAWNMEDFLSMMIEGKNGNELVSFIMDVANAIDNYKGSDGIEDAMWGYTMWGLEIRDESDIVDEARMDYLDDLADDIISDGSYSRKFDYPSEVEDLLDQWDSEDERGWIGAGTYAAYDQNDNEVEKKHFDDFDSYFEWTEDNELWSFDCVETDA